MSCTIFNYSKDDSLWMHTWEMGNKSIHQSGMGKGVRGKSEKLRRIFYFSQKIRKHSTSASSSCCWRKFHIRRLYKKIKEWKDGRLYQNKKGIASVQHFHFLRVCRWKLRDMFCSSQIYINLSIWWNNVQSVLIIYFEAEPCVMVT